MGKSMGSKPRVDVFVNVHKGLRRGLLDLAVQMGQVNWDNGFEVGLLTTEFENLVRFLQEHGANEDEIQFPMLEARVPGATDRDKDDHRKLEKELKQLKKSWTRLLKQRDRSKAGYQFYLAYNRFLSDYLAHMDREENEMTEAFYAHFADPELDSGFQKIMARTPTKDVVMMMGYMIPAMNGDERYAFLSKLEMTASSEVFKKAKGLAQKVLSPEDWKKLSTRLG
jgi:hemerythrin-like domain-containing protein